MTTKLTIPENSALSKLKKDIFSYLTDLHNNQIKGFYDWNGYWKKKDELELTEDQKQYLPELHKYMMSITIDEIVKAANDEGRDWLHKYGNYGRGRKSENQKYASKQAYCSSNTTFIKENYEILNRVRMFVGFYLGILNENEVLNLIEDTRQSELNSTFYSHPKSRISNAIFRMEILYSYLKESIYGANCLEVLQKLAAMQVQYLKESEGKTLDIEGYKTAISPVNSAINDLNNRITEMNNEKKEINAQISELQTKKREISQQYNISDFNQSFKYIS